LSSLANYFHTLRYLRPVQVIGRVRYELCRPRPDSRAGPRPREAAHAYAAPVPAAQSMLGPDRFRLLNIEGACSEAADWSAEGRPQLWAYNLHYFDDLNAADAASRRAWHERLIERWIEENPPGAGIGWDAYPVSRRMVNWIKWSLQGNALTPQGRQSLAVQARWLNRRVESHLQGNHVFANAKALVHAGLFFEGPEAGRWLRRGLSLMQTEIIEQVLADGGHFERSPMYHAGFIEDMLDTVNVERVYRHTVDAAWHPIIARMMVWLEAMSHPDMEIAFFNDSAFGVTPAAAQLRDYAARLGIALQAAEPAGLRRLMPSGYVRLDLPPFLVLCDVAPVGPDHLPAHAHADTLSFEMSYKGRRVFVNSGTSEYGSGGERQRQRGTAAHNTLMIDGENSSEVWAGFRVARRARARLLETHAEDSGFTVAGEHQGYRRLSGRNVHRRRWVLTQRELSIGDLVEGPWRSAECYFHLHPGIGVRRTSEWELQLSDSRGDLLEVRFEGADRIEIIDSTWHPQFGVSVPNRCVVARLGGPRMNTLIRAGGPS
jgi:uncharacterized heparinase superfamily protein